MKQRADAVERRCQNLEGPRREAEAYLSKAAKIEENQIVQLSHSLHKHEVHLLSVFPTDQHLCRSAITRICDESLPTTRNQTGIATLSPQVVYCRQGLQISEKSLKTTARSQKKLNPQHLQLLKWKRSKGSSLMQHQRVLRFCEENSGKLRKGEVVTSVSISQERHYDRLLVSNMFLPMGSWAHLGIHFIHRFAEFEKKDVELSQKKKLATQKLQKLTDDQTTRQEELSVSRLHILS